MATGSRRRVWALVVASSLSFLSTAVLSTSVLSTALPGPTRAAADAPFDVVIAGGHIVDGAGNPWYGADVGIRDKRIAAIGNLRMAAARRRIDAAGRVVCPGFVDMHSHASWKLLVDGRAVSKVTQGVTLEVEGEGESIAPV